MFSTRLEKLRFTVEEMQLAFHLTTQLTDSFVARTLARHVLIRANDLIEHTRALRRPLNNSGYDTRDFHRRKEAYATEFDEYFRISRNRLGAHLQDFDFGKRIELWNDIEIVKISFFVDGALEIYRSLAPLGLPGYVAHAEPPELSDPAVLDALLRYQRAIDSRDWVEIGTDPLAITRNGAVAVLNTTPIHARAGQLALIRRWIAMQRDLLDRFVAHPRIARVLKARIITDIVSFSDCLVTRPVSPGAPQAMDGLDALIVGAGQSSAAIDSFVAASRFQADLQGLRAIRDTIGAHLEIDESYMLESLLSALDSYDLDDGLRSYQLVVNVFLKACRSILFLRMYAADGQRLYGVSAGRTRAVPYSGSGTADPIATPALPSINDEESYQQNLTRWIDGDESQRGDARQFFWGAFAGSEAIETIEEVEHFGSGYRIDRHEFRKAHRFVLVALGNAHLESDFHAILDLILTCRSGWPYPLAELLVRYGRTNSVFRLRSILHTLGEIGSSPHGSVSAFLEEHGHSGSWPIRLQSALARFKTFVKAEGVFRINHKGQTTVEYDAVVNSLLELMNEGDRLVCLIAFASVLSGPTTGGFSQPFRGNYAALQSQIETLCLPFLRDDATRSKATVLKQLIQSNDYVGVCVLVAVALDGHEGHPLRAALIDSCCDQSIVTAGHDQAVRHLAMCFLLKKEHRIAFEIVEGLAARNPDWVDVQILAAQILGDTPGAEEQATKALADLRRSYTLSAENESKLAAVEAAIASRRSPGSIEGKG